MLSLPLSLWLAFSSVYLTSMGSGSEFGAIMAYEVSKRASVELTAGVATATQFRDRNSALNFDYNLTDHITTETGVGFEQYDLYAAYAPTVTKDVHCRLKFKVF